LLDLGRVTEIDAVGETDIIRAGRIQTVCHSLLAEIALLGGRAFFIKCDGIIRTSLYTTGAAGDTPFRLLSCHFLCKPLLNFLEVPDPASGFKARHLNPGRRIELLFLWLSDCLQFNISI
jgi:hypothetical protein